MTQTMEQRVIDLEGAVEEMQSEYKTIMHEVKQARQDSKNAVQAVHELAAKFDLILPFIMPNEAVGNIGLFHRLKAVEEKVENLIIEKKVIKGQVLVVAFFATIFFEAIKHYILKW